METVLRVCVALALGGLTLVINLSVFYRYVLNAPLSWSNELPRYLLIFAVLFAAAIALRHGLFVNIQVLCDALQPRARRTVGLAARLLIGGFLVIAALSPEALIERASLTRTVSPAMGIPMALMYRLLQAGFGTMLAFLLFGLVDDIVRQKESRREPETRP